MEVACLKIVFYGLGQCVLPRHWDTTSRCCFGSRIPGGNTSQGNLRGEKCEEMEIWHLFQVVVNNLIMRGFYMVNTSLYFPCVCSHACPDVTSIMCQWKRFVVFWMAMSALFPSSPSWDPSPSNSECHKLGAIWTGVVFTECSRPHVHIVIISLIHLMWLFNTNTFFLNHYFAYQK